MAINEYEFANGVVLNGLLKSGKSIKITEFPTTSKNSFRLNDNKVGIYIKHSKKVISPWRFTFLKEHQEEFKAMGELCDNVFLILVCGKDGIASIKNNILKKVFSQSSSIALNSSWCSFKKVNLQGLITFFECLIYIPTLLPFNLKEFLLVVGNSAIFIDFPVLRRPFKTTPLKNSYSLIAI